MGASVHFLTCSGPYQVYVIASSIAKAISPLLCGRCSWCASLNHPTESREGDLDVVLFVGVFIILSTHSFLICYLTDLGYLTDLTNFWPRGLCWWLATGTTFFRDVVGLTWLLWWDFPVLHVSNPGIAFFPLYWLVWKWRLYCLSSFNLGILYTVVIWKQLSCDNRAEELSCGILNSVCLRGNNTM